MSNLNNQSAPVGYSTVDKRMLFISTANNLNANSSGENIRLNMGSVDLSCGDAQHFHLVLRQFNMYKSWTNVNANNDKCVVNDGTSNLDIQLDNVNFVSVEDQIRNFAQKVNTALIGAGHYASGTIVINSPINLNNNNKYDFTITTNTAHGFSDDDLKLYCNVSLGDCFELLGAKRSKVDNTTNGWIMTAPTTTTLNFKSFYNCQISTEAYVYLCCDVINTTISTRNYDTGSTDTGADNVVFSNIFAKIPIQNDILAYDASTDNEFTARLNNTRHLSYIRLYIVDSKGRNIPLIEPDQNTLGNRFFEAVLEVQTMEKLGKHLNHFHSNKDTSSAIGGGGFLTAFPNKI